MINEADDENGHHQHKNQGSGRSLSMSNLLDLTSSSSTSLLASNDDELNRLNFIDHLEGEFFAKVENVVERFVVHVSLASDVQIYTVKVHPHDKGKITKPPMLFLHGLCAGVAFWSKMMDVVSQNRVCYFIDMPGFAKSSRVEFGTDPTVNIITIIDLIDQWRIAVGLREAFDIFGHSFGGYIASCYCLRHTELVRNLVLLDPWGIYTPEKDWYEKNNPDVTPILLKALSLSMNIVNPLSLMRVGGIASKYVMAKFRDDIYEGFADFVDKDTFFEYIYYCNNGEPTGEKLYASCQNDMYFAKYPITSQARKFSNKLKVCILSASDSVDYHINRQMGEQMAQACGEERVIHKIFPDQKHHLYSNNRFVKELSLFFNEHL